MRESLKAWVQDPDDWRINYNPKPKNPSIINRITNWIENLIFNTWIGFFFIIIILSSLGCWLAGMS